MALNNRIICFIVFCFQACLAQNTLSQKLQEKINSIGETPQVHVQFNQPKYAPGETAYYCLRFLDNSGKRMPGRVLFECHLVDNKGKSIQKSIISVVDGIGANQLELPDSLSSGFYFASFFPVQITKVVPNETYNYMLEIVSNYRLNHVPVPEYLIEGGSLIEYKQNCVLVSNAKVNSRFKIVNSEGRMLAEAVSDSLGFARLEFYLRSDSSYYLSGPNLSTQLLPKPREKGLTLTIDNSKDDSVIFHFEKSRVNIVNFPIHFLIVRNDSVLVHKSYVTLNRMSDAIPRKSLPFGTCTVAILDDNGSLMDIQKLFQWNNYNRGVLKLKTDKTTYRTRQKVSVSLETLKSAGTPIPANFSIRVFKHDLFSGTTRQPVTTLSQSSFHQLDQRYWTNTSLNSIYASKFTPRAEEAKPSVNAVTQFQRVIEVSGLAKDESGKRLPDLTQIFFYLQNNKVWHQTFTNDGGKFSFTLPDFFGQDHWFVFGKFREKYYDSLRIEWTKRDVQLPLAPHSVTTDIADVYANYALKRRLINTSYQFYTDSAARSAEANIVELLPPPDLSINLSDYKIFPTMVEFVEDVIKPMQHRKVKKRSRVLIKVSPPLKSNHDPVYFIDGQITKSTNEFLALIPENVLTIDIIYSAKKLLPLGLMGKNGIVIVRTKQDQATSRKIAVNHSITGLNPLAKFLPKYYNLASSDANIPDFRSCIYWEPSINTNENGRGETSFYLSDNTGIICIEVIGITVNGEYMSAQSFFSVDP